MRSRVAAPGAHSASRSKSSASSGLTSRTPGCGQSLPHTSRSHPRHFDQRRRLRHVFERPELLQKLVHALPRHMLARQTAKLLLHFRVRHRVLPMPAMVIDAHAFALSGFQPELEIAEVVFLFDPVGFIGWYAFDAAYQIEQPGVM